MRTPENSSPVKPLHRAEYGSAKFGTLISPVECTDLVKSVHVWQWHDIAAKRRTIDLQATDHPRKHPQDCAGNAASEYSSAGESRPSDSERDGDDRGAEYNAPGVGE